MVVECSLQAVSCFFRLANFCSVMVECIMCVCVCAAFLGGKQQNMSESRDTALGAKSLSLFLKRVV